jgi:hypothetical protein
VKTNQCPEEFHLWLLPVIRGKQGQQPIHFGGHGGIGRSWSGDA